MNDPLSLEERAMARGTLIPRENLASLRGWFPVALAGNPPELVWRRVGDKRFVEPFFRDTLASLSNERLCCHTAVQAAGEVDDALEPAAVIFHVSRCGSTLLTQMLATLPQCSVLSEPPVIDSFLRRQAADSDAGGSATLRSLVRALAQRRFAAERHFVLKLDSWHIHRLPLFRAALPDTPFLFLYREPGAVLASHRRRRGPQMVPGVIAPERLGLAPHDAATGDLDGYGAKVLEGFMVAALQHAAELRLIDYAEFPAIVWSDLLARFSLACTEAQRDELRSRALRHSKEPARDFNGDPEAEDMRVDLGTVRRCYAKLDALRRDQRA